MPAPDTAIAGLGMTELGKVYGRTPREFAAQAVRAAVDDAGLRLDDVDGLLVNPGITGGEGRLDLRLQADLGLVDLALAAQVQAFGSSAGVMVAQAAAAIATGGATTVACVFADAPLAEGRGAGAAYADPSLRPGHGLESLSVAAGLVGPTPHYALAARRHMNHYGTTSEQFGAVAVSTRAWAALNPRAQMREEMTLADHQASRWIAEPLHLLDCCLVSNGAIAVVVTSGDRARSGPRPAVHVRGWGQCHPGWSDAAGSSFGLATGAAESGRRAYAMAGVGPRDIGVREIYDCYTYTTVVSLEDYGFCATGEGGALAASGALGPGGDLPTNTGGGQLSGYYLWGMTPLSEAVIQARGEAGERQVDDHDLVLVSGNGGLLDHHSTLILSPHRSTA